jgi:hypothetical protein
MKSSAMKLEPFDNGRKICGTIISIGNPWTFVVAAEALPPYPQP